jgi:hypothetical protein
MFMEFEPNFKTLSKPAYSLGFQNSKHIDFIYIYIVQKNSIFVRLPVVANNHVLYN